MHLRRALAAGAAALGFLSSGAAHADTGLQVSAADFAYGGAIPAIHEGNALGCSGANQPLTLSWNGVPAGTRSLAVSMVDYTAGAAGGFVHWLAYNIPATRTGISPSTLRGVDQGVNDAGTAGYFGPCPPAGSAHTYIVTVWALDRSLPSGHLSFTQFQHDLKQHLLGAGSTAGTFQIG